jgi:hypothetical protein
VTAVDAANANGPIAFSPDGKVVLFASNNRLHRSDDSLASSSPVLETPGFIEAIEFAAAKPEVIYVASRGLRVHRSGDGGKTWTAAGALRTDLIEK